MWRPGSLTVGVMGLSAVRGDGAAFAAEAGAAGEAGAAAEAGADAGAGEVGAGGRLCRADCAEHCGNGKCQRGSLNSHEVLDERLLINAAGLLTQGTQSTVLELNVERFA